MGRKKKTVVGIKELEELDILHNDINIINLNNNTTQLINLTDVQDNNIILNDKPIEKNPFYFPK